MAVLLVIPSLLPAQMDISGGRLWFVLLSSEHTYSYTGEGPPSQNNRLCFQNLALSLSKSHLPLPAQTRTDGLIYLRCDFPTHHLHSLPAQFSPYLERKSKQNLHTEEVQVVSCRRNSWMASYLHLVFWIMYYTGYFFFHPHMRIYWFLLFPSRLSPFPWVYMLAYCKAANNIKLNYESSSEESHFNFSWES